MSPKKTRRCVYKEQIYMFFSLFLHLFSIWRSKVKVSHIPHSRGKETAPPPPPNHIVASLWKTPRRLRLVIKNCESGDPRECCEIQNWRESAPEARSKNPLESMQVSLEFSRLRVKSQKQMQTSQAIYHHSSTFCLFCSLFHFPHFKRFDQ